MRAFSGDDFGLLFCDFSRTNKRRGEKRNCRLPVLFIQMKKYMLFTFCSKISRTALHTQSLSLFLSLLSLRDRNVAISSCSPHYHLFEERRNDNSFLVLPFSLRRCGFFSFSLLVVGLPVVLHCFFFVDFLLPHFFFLEHALEEESVRIVEALLQRLQVGQRRGH